MPRGGGGAGSALGVLLALSVALLSACSTGAPEVSAFATVAPSDLPPAPRTVPLTLYFGAVDSPMLQRERREIAKTDDPSRTALELLIAGPRDDGAQPVVPPDLRISHFSVADEVATVVLDGKVDGEAVPRGVTSGHAVGAEARDAQRPLLALAAIANTLTEFPSIASVELSTTDGEGAFSGWGIPDRLVRDESFIAPPTADPFSALRDFSTSPQSVGTADAPPATVAGVRVLDRLGYVRLAVELEAPADTGPATAVVAPPTVARAVGGDLVVRISEAALADGVPSVVEGPGAAVEDVSLRMDGRVLEVRVPSADGHSRPFHLLSDSNPTRILLDVKK